MAEASSWAVVTGAGSGIGRACAVLFAKRGHAVLCVGRRPDPLKETIELLTVHGASGRAVSADVGTEEGIDRVVEALPEEPLLAIVHAAGQELVRELGTTSRDEFARVFATNLAGPYFLTAALLERLAPNAGVVFVSSIAALAGRDRHSAYGAAKAALVGLTKNLAVELAPQLRVNCLLPGATHTPMLDEALLAFVEAHPGEDGTAYFAAEARRLLLGRAATPEEIATSAVFMALDATASTGSILTCDLGYTA